MKRVIKYWSHFSENETGAFSDSSTKFEVLPILVPDNAGPKELKAVAKKLGISTRRPVVRPTSKGKWGGMPESSVTHAMKTGELTEPKGWDKKKQNYWLGFVTLKEGGTLEPVEKPKSKMTKEQANQIVNYAEYGVRDVGNFSMEPKGKDMRVVMESHHYYSQMELLGYDRMHFEKLVGVTDKDYGRDFDDAVFCCGECGTWDSNDNGYTYNYRIIDGEQLGINCGCHHEVSKKNFASHIDNTHTPMELEGAEELEQDGILEHKERFFGGMTDGRSGYFRGESCRSYTPAGALKEYQEKFPKSKFLFSHDESGQFQSYFSIWEVTPKGMAKIRKQKKAA